LFVLFCTFICRFLLQTICNDNNRPKLHNVCGIVTTAWLRCWSSHAGVMKDTRMCDSIHFSILWGMFAHAQKGHNSNSHIKCQDAGSCCPILLPDELLLTILVQKQSAKFGDYRLRIGDARVVKDGHTDRCTHILLVSYFMHAIHCIV
jgi:hypothetical protein